MYHDPYWRDNCWGGDSYQALVELCKPCVTALFGEAMAKREAEEARERREAEKRRQALSEAEARYIKNAARQNRENFLNSKRGKELLAALNEAHK